MQPLHDITILVAEDERPVRMLLRVVLESAGATVLEAENGACALRVLDLHPHVDVLCTDIHMPVLDGDGLVRAVRARRPGMPVVACSALDLDEARPELATRVDSCIQKPFVPGDLVRAIVGSLRRAAEDAAASDTAAAS
jgi:CheY-like chemotaxis protein